MRKGVQQRIQDSKEEDARRDWESNGAIVASEKFLWRYMIICCRISLFIAFEWSVFTAFSVDFHNNDGWLHAWNQK